MPLRGRGVGLPVFIPLCFAFGFGLPLPGAGNLALAHDPEKSALVFGQDHAQAKCQGCKVMQANWITL
jgi:hypothetical protein